MGLLKAESYAKGIISSTIFNFGAKGLGFVNSLLIVYFFGSNFNTDLYFLILATVVLITSFVNGIDLLILIPEAMRLRIKSGEKAENSFLNFFVFLYSLIGLCVSLIILAAPALFYTLFSKYGYHELEQQKLMLILSSVLLPLQLLNSLFISVLTSHRYFTVPMVVSLINSIISIVILILLRNRFSIASAIIALAAGYIANFGWLIYSVKKNLRWKFFEKLTVPSKKVFSNIFLIQINVLPISFRSYITILLLSGLGTGIITSLNYGQQISFIPEMLIVTQVIAVAGIKFNELSSRNLTEDLNNFFSDLLSMLLVITLPIAAILALTSDEIVFEIFRYTKKVNAETTANVSLIIFFLALTLPARALDMVMTKLITAQQRIREGVIYAVIIHIVIALLVFMGIKWFDLKGYLGAFFIAYNIFLPILYYFLIRRVTPFIQYTKWLVKSLPFIFFNILLVGLFLFVKKYLLSGINPLAVIFIISLCYGSAVLIFNYISGYYIPLNTMIRKIVLRK